MALDTSRWLLIVIGVGCFWSGLYAQAHVSTGRVVVRSIDGKAVSGVWALQLGSEFGHTTESDGRFDFPPGEVPVTLMFFKDGFRPELRVIDPSEIIDGLVVTLEAETTAVLTVRSCGRHKSVLREWEPAKVHGLELRRGGDVDFTGYYGTYDYQGSKAYLSSETGVHMSGLTPRPEWFAGLSSFTIRSITCGDEQWFDLRGSTEKGLRSRWVGHPASHIEYSKVPAQLADIFDRAIDKGCCH
jgi:hypothetical protein